MKLQQIVRIDKIYDQSIYLLNKVEESNKYIFNVCGSTKNIYSVKIYKYSKMIYCTCPDTKSYAKQAGVICKHACFILLKVLKLINSDDFFNILLFNESQMNYINNEFNKLIFIENEFIKLEYIDKFNKLTDDKIIVNSESEILCPICYDDLEDIENKLFNNQCKCCLKIFHNICLNKWINMGNNNCPYCRSIIKSNFYKFIE
tara:strand:+ start:120 stop:728 length:609 start_codon:yes stop_codon:yes gene_type:complete